MNPPIVFADVLEAAEQFDVEAQAELVEILSRHLAERGRERVAEAVSQALREHAGGQSRTMTAAEIVREGLE